jgi:surface protein
MSQMFLHNKKFNQDISGWDVSHVGYINQLFYGAKSFNQDISNWIFPQSLKQRLEYKGQLRGVFEKCPILPEYKPKQLQ